MTLLEDRLQEAVDARQAAADSRAFVRAFAREQVLRRQLQERTFSAAERETAAKKGQAMPHGGFLIKNAQDLKNAIQAVGRAKNPEAAKAHIKQRAKALGLTSQLPDSWKLQESAGRTGGLQRYAVAVLDVEDSNWVARVGGLPNYIQNVAKGIMKSGKSESRPSRRPSRSASAGRRVAAACTLRSGRRPPRRSPSGSVRRPSPHAKSAAH